MPKRSNVTLTEARVDAGRRRAKATGKESVVFDRDMKGLGIRFRPGGAVFFIWYRRGGKPKRSVLGAWPALTVSKAREAASTALAEVAKGGDPVADKKADRANARAAIKETVEARFKAFKKAKSGLRSWVEYQGIFDNHILPRWKKRIVSTIRRSDLVKLLDEIASENGPMLADRVLAYVRPFLHWQASKDDAFALPSFRGLRRTKPAERRRERSLDDDEIRALWAACDKTKPPLFGKFVKVLLLTAQRRDEVAGMERGERSGDLWAIPAERFKGKREHVAILPASVTEILDDQPKLGRKFYFTTEGKAPIQGFTKWKRKLDKLMLAELQTATKERGGDPSKIELKPWTLHDLRRSARSLMSRAGVRPDHAEALLGHALPSLQATYDRWHMVPEKRAASEAFVSLLDRIVKNQVGEVVQFRREAG